MKVLNDLKTVLMACVATLAPLVILVITMFGIRIMWIQYKTRKKARRFDGNSARENTLESISKPLHSHLLSDKAEK
ncbi:hypothetical protein HUJ04_007500 [Dendroctonus ponderosae]|nr:hypothetical protein HUJ04_007500 [Dendroctonus ponderosae]